MKAIAFLLFISLSSAGINAQNINFVVADPHPDLYGGLFGDLEFSDIDADGDMDLFICGRIDGWISSDSSTFYLNDGTGNFTEVIGDGIQNLQLASIEFADFDNDGDDDLVVMGQGDSSQLFAGLYLNDGTGAFELEENSPFIACSNGDVTTGDVDGNGTIDIFTMGMDSNEDPFTRLYLNTGSAEFTEVNATPFLAISGGSMELVDMDGDADLDLMSIGSNESGEPFTSLHINDGVGGFTSVPSGIDNFDSGDFAIADLDADGDKDMVLSGAKSDGAAYTEIYMNDGLGNFSLFAGNDVFPDLSQGKNHCADLDGDSDMDIVLTGTADGGLGSEVGIITNIFENLGANTFVLADSLTGAYVVSSDLGDVDGDGDLDFLVSGTTVGTPTFKTWLFFNESEMSVGFSDDFTATAIDIFPNPSDGHFIIDFDNGIGSTIEIYSQKGELVHTAIVQDELQELDLDIADGVYSVVITKGESIFEKKVYIFR